MPTAEMKRTALPKYGRVIRNRDTSEARRWTFLDELLFLIAGAFAIVTIVTFIASTLDLTASQSIKMSIAYIIMGSMFVGRLVED